MYTKDSQKNYIVIGKIPAAKIMKNDAVFSTEKAFGETNDLEEAKAIAEKNVQIFKTEWKENHTTVLKEEKIYPKIYIKNDRTSRPTEAYYFNEKRKMWMHVYY